MKRIESINIQNFLYENDCFPVDEDDTGAAYYKETKRFFSLLDAYYIRFKIFPNKF